MDLTIHASFLPHIDPDAFLAFSREVVHRCHMLAWTVLPSTKERSPM